MNSANTVQTANNLIITGELKLTGGTLALGTNDLTIESDVVISRTNGVINLGTGDLIYKAASLNTANFSSTIIDNIELNRAGGTIALTGNLAVTNGFTLTSGTFDIASNTLSFNGSITHTTGAIDADAGTVNFNNASPYTISSGLFSGAIYGLGANGGALTLSNPTTVSNLLSMGGANIISSDANVLAVGTSKTNTGSITWTSGTIVGPLKRWFADATNSTGVSATDRASGIFPVGMAALNRYAQINFTESSGGGYLIVKYKTGKPLDPYSNFPLSNNEANYRYIQNADTTGYWELTPYSINGTEYGALNDKYYKLKLRINTPGSINQVGILNDPPSLRLVKAPGNHPDADGHGPWEPAGTFSGLQTINAGTDYVIESSNVKGFSWFNGGGNNENPLPVVLLSFTGNCENEQVTLNWSTASEHQSAYFEVEKSRNGIDWAVVKTIPAAGNSIEKLNYTFLDENSNTDYSYYRLTQVDENGDSEMFNTILVSCDASSNLFQTLPNPSDASFQVLVSNKSLVGKATIKIVDTKGRVVSTREVQVEEGTNLFYLNENRAPGIYYISISNGNVSTEVVKHSMR